ncbi:MAG: DUF4157 domain-containing protein [Deltaproteobacteria bacterium]|nr:DUF4157 domain-containing protein [Deltaproteobacteria bacterium]
MLDHLAPSTRAESPTAVAPTIGRAARTDSPRGGVAPAEPAAASRDPEDLRAQHQEQEAGLRAAMGFPEAGTPVVQRRAGELGAGAPGAALPGDLRTQFERSLGVGLGGVRVHTDDRSAAAAQDLGAHAFAVDQDVHFAPGQYRPGTSDGAWLLAHEVAHTVQQRGAASGPQARLAVGASGAPAEREADRAADAMMTGEPATISAAPRAIMRFDAGSGGHQGIERDVGGLARDSGLGTPKHLEDAEGTPGSREAGVDAIYAGNFMQDFSQFNTPMVLGNLAKLPRDPVAAAQSGALAPEAGIGMAGAESLTSALIRALAILEVGPRLASSLIAGNMQQYRPEQHVDQPLGYAASTDTVVRDSASKALRPGRRAVEGGAKPGHRIGPAPVETIDTDRDRELVGSAVPGIQVENPELFKISPAGLQNHIYNSAEWIKGHWLKAARKGATDEGRFHIGAGLHAIEDYFAHSNFVEVGLNSYIDWALARKPAAAPANVGKFLARVQANERDARGVHATQKVDGAPVHVDTLFDRTITRPGPKGSKGGKTRQAITTGSVGADDMKSSIGHILLPQVPVLQGAINGFIDHAFHLIETKKVSGWASLKRTLGEDRPKAAVAAVGDGLDAAGVTLPVPDGVKLSWGSVGPIKYPDDFDFTTKHVGFTHAIGTYLGFVHSVQTAIDDIQDVIKYAKRLLLGPIAFALEAMTALIDQLRDLLKAQLEEVKEAMKHQLTVALVGIIDAVTGRDLAQDKDRAIGDVLAEATAGLEDIEAHTSLEARLLSPHDLGGLSREEIEPVVGPVDPAPGGGWIARTALPPSHSEIAKDHAPVDANVDAPGTPVRDAAAATVGELAHGSAPPKLDPSQPPGVTLEPDDGSIFYGLGRALAIEADRHVLQQVERMWAEDLSHHGGASTRGSLYGDAKPLDTSAMVVDTATVDAEAQTRATDERERAGAAGYGYAQADASNAIVMHRPEVRKLMNLVDLIIAHPDDSTWWRTVVDGYVSAHPDEVANHIQARNSTRRHRTRLP